MHRHAKLSLAAIVSAAACAVAFASNGGMEREVMAIVKARIPLTLAITIAEHYANGKALQAEFENSMRGWVYDVEVVSGVKVFDVRVDADNGTVISSVEDKPDHDDYHFKKYSQSSSTGGLSPVR